MSIVRKNLMTRPGYSPYCGNDNCSGRMPRTKWDGEQFECPSCGWRSEFPASFIDEYRDKWGIEATHVNDPLQIMDDMETLVGRPDSLGITIGKFTWNRLRTAVTELQEDRDQRLLARIARLESCLLPPPLGFCEGIGDEHTRFRWLHKINDIVNESPEQSCVAVKVTALREVMTKLIQMGSHNEAAVVQDEIDRLEGEHHHEY